MEGAGSVYLDSSIIVKLVVAEPDSLFFSGQVDGTIHVCSSELALTECWSALCRKKKNGIIDPRVMTTAWNAIEAKIAEGSLSLYPITTVVLQRANLLIDQCLPAANLKTLDAIHLATCDLNRLYPLLSNDVVMRKAAGILNIPTGPVAPRSRSAS